MKRAAALTLLLAVACSSGASKAVRATPTPAPTPSAATPTSTSTAATLPSAAPSVTGTPRPGPAGTAVPRRFEPLSATFVSERTGWVLGKAPCARGAGSCDAVVRTRDGGRTWRALPAPRTSPDHLLGLRFADEADGFAYGDGLWVTHDGAATWHQVPGWTRVTRLEAAHRRVWFFAQDHAARTGPVDGDRYTRVPDLTDESDLLVLHGSTVLGSAYAGHGATNLVVGGPPFTARATPCRNDDTPVLAARTASDLLLVCAGGAGAGTEEKSAFRSSDQGRTWTRLADPPPHTGTWLSAVPGAYVVADSQQVSVSRDGGRTWTRSLAGNGGLSDSGFVSAALGFAIGYGDAGATLFLTRDTGRHWETVAF